MNWLAWRSSREAGISISMSLIKTTLQQKRIGAAMTLR